MEGGREGEGWGGGGGGGGGWGEEGNLDIKVFHARDAFGQVDR